MIRRRPVFRKTPTYKFEYVSDGDFYSAQADFLNFTKIDNTLEAFMRITGGGVLKGWEVINRVDNDQDASLQKRKIVIKPGIGIIPFVQDRVDPITREKVVDEDGQVIRETYYVAIRTQNEIVINPAVGLNRRSVVYVALSEEIIQKLDSQNTQDFISEEEIIDFDSETEIVVKPSIDDEKAGRTGSYRNAVPANGEPDSYPIQKWTFDGNFNSQNEKVTIFVNGKPHYQKFVMSGKTIVFDDPLHKEDQVVVRVDPRYGLALAEIISDGTQIIKIDNSIRVSAFLKSADNLIYKKLIEHEHSGSVNEPEKILLTTKTEYLNPVSSENSKTYVFEKRYNDQSFLDYYGFSFDNGTYSFEVYINGFLNSDEVTLSDSQGVISISFSQSLEPSDLVQLVLYVDKKYTQITGKLNPSQSSPSQENIDVEVSGESIGSGSLDLDLIPTLSHEGIFDEPMMPSNSEDIECVHNVEVIDSNFGTEFFPVLKKKTNARKCLKVFAEPKNSTSKQIIHACASDGIVFREVPFSQSEKERDSRTGWIMGSRIGQFNDGWNNIFHFLEDNLRDFDAPFEIIPLKDVFSSNNWDGLFFVSEKYVFILTWENTGILSSSEIKPTLRQVLNFSSDESGSQGRNNPYYIKIKNTSGIKDACAGKGIVNLERTFYFLDNNEKVWCYDYIKNRYTWLDITKTKVWSNAEKIFSISSFNEEEFSDNIGNDILFVGTSDGAIYFNPIGRYRLENNLNSGGSLLSNIKFAPSDTWDGNDNKLIVSGDNVLLVTDSGVTEKKTVSSAIYSSTGTYPANIQFQTTTNTIFQGKSGTLYNSALIRDWKLLADSLVGTPQKAFYHNESKRLFILTTRNLYVSSSTFETKDDINYITSSVSFSKIFSTDRDLNDVSYIGSKIMVSGDSGIWKVDFSYGSIPMSASNSNNETYGSTLIDLLSPSNTLFKSKYLSENEDTLFSLGKYGIFQTTNEGDDWRNTLQTICQPEDKNFTYNFPKSSLKIIGFDESINRIYIAKYSNSYAYGYGYGYDEDPESGNSYFDVLDLDSLGKGFGSDTFEDSYSNEYGYGYGFEVLNTIRSLAVGDWIYFSDNSGSKYENVPIRILGLGSEIDKFYIDIEEGNGSQIDFENIYLNSKIEVYSQINPLAIVNDVPQNILYETTDIKEYSFDFHRQSVTFDLEVNEDDLIEIASQYKVFKSVEDYEIADLENNTTIRWRGLSLVSGDSPIWTRSVGEDYFAFNSSFNIDDILRLNIRGTHITDIGNLSHEEIEDKISEEMSGLSYQFDGVRTTNFLRLLMSLNHTYGNNYNISLSEEISGSITSFYASDVSSAPYIENSSVIYADNALDGRIIEFYEDGKTYRFTIGYNTSERIYLQRIFTYEDLSSFVDETNKTFYLDKSLGVSSTMTVYLNGEITSAYTEIITDDNLVGFEFDSIPDPNSQIIVRYISIEDNFDFEDFLYVGQTFNVPGIRINPFHDLQNFYISMYREESLIIDTDLSFIENSILQENSDIGSFDYSLSYLYGDTPNGYMLAGTETGIWKRLEDSLVWKETGSLLETINATGILNLGNEINDAYIEFNSTTKEWKVTWGGQPSLKDENLDLDDIVVNDIIHCTDTVLLAASSRGVYRSEDGGENWNLIWNTILDDLTKDSPSVSFIVIDDIHPWISNAILESGLYRSFDYGNNWIKITDELANEVTSFSYQSDTSDSRSQAYIAGNKLIVKRGSNDSFLSDSRQDNFQPREVFGNDILFGNCKSINNLKNSPREVFFGYDVLGVFKSEILGFEPDLWNRRFNEDIKYGQLINTIGFDELGIKKTNALNDAYHSEEWISDKTYSKGDKVRLYNSSNFSDYTSSEFYRNTVICIGDTSNASGGNFEDVSSDWEISTDETIFYSLYVDRLEKRTFVSFWIDPAKTRVPQDGELCDSYIRFPDKNYYKVIDNYDRGPRPYHLYWRDHEDRYTDFRIHEVILDGAYQYNSNRDGANSSESEQFHYYNSNNPLNSGFDRLSPSIVKESNGYEGRINLYDFPVDAYAVKSDIFNEGTDETVLILDYESIADIPSDLQDEDYLSGYYIRKPNSNEEYRIYNSKVLESSDEYYDHQSSPARGSLALRLEKIEDSSEDFRFSKSTDPYYLWYKFYGLELQNNSRVFIFDSSDVEDDPDWYDTLDYSASPNNPTHISGSGKDKLYEIDYSVTTCFVAPLMHFEGNREQFCVVVTFNDRTDASSTDWDADNALKGKFIGNPSTDYRYEIIESKRVVSGDSTYFADQARIILKLERYGSSKISGLTLCSDGNVDQNSIEPNSITLVNSSQLQTNALRGYRLYFESRPLVGYRIVSNTSSEIVVDYNELDSSYISNDRAFIKYNISERNCNSLIVDPNNDNVIFCATTDYCYMSSDRGKTWKTLFEGLTFDEEYNSPLQSFNSIRKLGDYLYGSVNSLIYGGIYIYDLTSSTPSWINITENYISGLKCNSFSVEQIGSDLEIVIGTDNGIHFGTVSGTNPENDWTFEVSILPENNISAIETIQDQDDDIDLDTIWIGTEGSGLYQRKQDSNGDLTNVWIGNLDYEVTGKDIESSRWRVWKTIKKDSIEPIVVSSKQESDVFEKQSVGNSFEWDFKIDYDKNLGPIYLATDSLNANYFTDSFSSIDNKYFYNRVTSQSSKEFHRLRNFITSATSNSEKFHKIASGNGRSLDSNSRKIMSIDFSNSFSGGESIYEEPFKHYPDLDAITYIGQIPSDGRVIVATDREGIWRSESAGTSFIYPNPNADYTNHQDYGFDFSYTMFDPDEDVVMEYPGQRFQDYPDNFSGSAASYPFNHLLEKLIYFKIPSSNAAATAITNDFGVNYEDLVGSRLVISRTRGSSGINKVSEVQGPKDHLSYIVRRIVKDGSDYILYLSSGRVSVETIPDNESKTTPVVSETTNRRWNQHTTLFDDSNDEYESFYFLNFETFTRISSGLPFTYPEKNTKGENKCSLSILDVEFNGNQCFIACGSHGVYSSTIDDSTPSWSQFGTWDNSITSTSVVYDGSDLYVGTWGNGVLLYSGGSYSAFNTGLNHLKIWCLHYSSTATGMYAGTEHGGIYFYNTVSGEWESQGGIRSKIYHWKTTGVPVRKADVSDESVFDYSNNEYLISYSFGGGVMTSLDRGATWTQANDGLSNLYIQDVSISAESGEHNVAYAATCGGGVYRTTNIFSSNPTWTRCSVDGLPITLNVSDVEVGTDKDIAFVKCNINDLSMKDIPYRFRNAFYSIGRRPRLSVEDQDDNFRTFNEFWYRYSFPEDLSEPKVGLNGNSYEPIHPYRKGETKHVIYKTLDGGSTWTVVYDIESEPENASNYESENIISGLTIVPGSSQDIRFISNYKISFKQDGQSYDIRKIAYTSITDGVFSEKEISENLSLENNFSAAYSLNNLSSEAFISIDPKDTNKVYVTFSYKNVFDKKRMCPILYSENDGSTWVRRISNESDNAETGFNTAVQISTYQEPQNVIFSGIEFYEEISGSIELIGRYIKSSIKDESFYWENEKNNARRSSQYISGFFDQDDADYSSEYKVGLFLNSSNGDLPYNAQKGSRPFDLTGATLTPDYNSYPSTQFTISAGGIEDYFNRKTSNVIISQLTTVKLNSQWDNSYLDNGDSTEIRITGLTSIRIPYSVANTSGNKLLTQENSLVGLRIFFGNETTGYPIAFHRYHEEDHGSGTQEYIEIIVVGSDIAYIQNKILAEETIDFTLELDRPVYCNTHNNVLVSINGGRSWKEIDSSFGSSSMEIVASAMIPAEFNSPNQRTFAVMFKVGNEYVLRFGEVLSSDERYDGESRDNIQWHGVSLSASSDAEINDVVEDGLRFVEIDSTEYLYITTSNKIVRATYNGGYSIGAWTKVIDGRNISYPLEVSNIDNERMSFVADGVVYSTDDAFSTTPNSYDISSNNGGIDINVEKILISPTENSLNTVFIAVNNNESYVSRSAEVISINTSTDDNLIVVEPTIDGKNPFLSGGYSSSSWEGRSLAFRDESTLFGYETKIVSVQGHSIQTLDTLNVILNSIDYNPLSRRTILSGSINITVDDIKEYLGTIYVIYLGSDEIVKGRISNIDLDEEDSILTIQIDSDIRSLFASRSIDFLNSFPSLRLGKITDIVSSNFTGNVISSRPTRRTEANGLYISRTLGSGFSKVDVFERKDDKNYGCLDVSVNDNDSINVVMQIETPTIFVNNDWMNSSNINKVSISEDGTIYAATERGLFSFVIDLESRNNILFDNFYFNNFKNILIDSQNIVLVDEEDDIYVREISGLSFTGNEEIVADKTDLQNINKLFKDRNGVVWIATENSGLWGYYGNSFVNYDESTIQTNNVKDIIQDGLGRIWVALGDFGVGQLVYDLDGDSIQNSNWEIFNQGIVGSVESIVQKSGLSYVSDGSATNPYIRLNWNNSSAAFPNALLLRSRTDVSPTLPDVIPSVNPVFGQIQSITGETATINNVSREVWRIQVENFSSNGFNAIEFDSLAGRKVFVNSRENDTVREVLSNDLDYFLIEKKSTDLVAPTSAGKYFFLCETIDEDYSVLFTGNPNSIGSRFLDTNIVNNSTYNYYFIIYNSSTNGRVEVDSANVGVSSISKPSENGDTIVVATTSATYRYKPNESPIFSEFFSLNEINSINDMYFDTSGRLWISAGESLIVSSDSSQRILDKNSLFGTKASSLEGDMIVRNVIEGIDKEIIIATNLGIVIINPNDEDDIFSYIQNESIVEYIDDNNDFIVSNWKPVYVEESNSSDRGFMKTNVIGSKYYYSNNGILVTLDNGNTWNVVVSSQNEVVRAIESYDSNDDLIDYVLFGADFISSTGDSSIPDNFDITSNLENLPPIVTTSPVLANGEIRRSTFIGSPAHIYLSEPSLDSESPQIFAGNFDNRIVETEIEISKISFDSVDDFGTSRDYLDSTIDYISESEGLIINSIYCIVDGSGSELFAGSKDNVLKYNGTSWTPISISESGDGINIPETSFVSLSYRSDSTGIESGDILYASTTGLRSKNSHEIYAIRPSVTDLDKKFRIYKLDQGFSNSNNRAIRWVDRPGFEPYYTQFRRTRTIHGHRGSIYFLDSDNKSLLAGGFNNSLFILPFTTDLTDVNTNKYYMTFEHSRENNIDVDIPLADHQYDLNGKFSFGYSYMDDKYSPRNAWNIKFLNISNEDVGFVSMFLQGQNTDSIWNYYKYQSLNDISYFMKSSIDGMIWESFHDYSSQTFPSSIVSDMEYYSGKLFASVVYGKDVSNIGLFYSSDEGLTWTRSENDLGLNVPIYSVDKDSDNLYISTSGFGIQKYNGTSYSDYESRFTTQYGIGFGRWNVTAISQDPNDQNRVIVGTLDRGLMLGNYVNDKWIWSQDNGGLENRQVTEAEILPVNSQIILIGIKDDGLYKKNNITGDYEKIVSGVPSSGNVIRIYVNPYVESIENSFSIEAQGDTIMIVRSPFEPLRQNPVNGIDYEIRETVNNGEVIYIGTDTFSDGLYTDSDVTLKGGIPYFYRIYERTGSLGDYTYTERGLIQGLTSIAENLTVSVDGVSWTEDEFEGRLLSLNTVANRPLNFEILSNTSDTLTLKSDPYRIINQGDVGIFGRDVLPYRIESSLIKNPNLVKPVFMIFKETTKGIVYISNDNGNTWSNISISPIDAYDVLDITVSNNPLSKTSTKHVIYVSTDNGLFKSSDNGSSWVEVSLGTNGLPQGVSYLRVLADSQDGTILYVIRDTGQIYRTIDKDSNWSEITEIPQGFNDVSIVSEFDNSIYIGFDSTGIKRYYDPVREEFSVQIDADGKITSLNFDEFEMGDTIFSDANTIVANTVSKNDSVSRNYEQITFKVDDETKFVTFKFGKKSNLFKTNEVFVGENLLNPSSNPFVLQNPGYENDLIRINKLGRVNENEMFSISNRGVHTSTDGGQVWQKIDSAFIPSEVFDLVSTKNNEIILATNNGLWASDTSRNNYRNIEQLNNNVNVAWESYESGTRKIYRGGDRGLYITIERPPSRSVIVYSGEFSNSEKKIEFSWGDLVSPNDGGFSDGAIQQLSRSQFALKSSTDSTLYEYKGWNEALIVRIGPFSTFEKAQEAAARRQYTTFTNLIMYPQTMSNLNTFDFGVSPIFENSTFTDPYYLEEIRDFNINGYGAVGVSLDPKAWFTNGEIIIGRLPNVTLDNDGRNTLFPTINNYPTTDSPVIDKVDALVTGRTINPNYADIEAYSDLLEDGSSIEGLTKLQAQQLFESQGKLNVLAPSLLENKYYIYKVQPFRMVPSANVVDQNGAFPTFPRYIPSNGDDVESYSYIIRIEKFTGSKKILCGDNSSDGNWVVGTDAGLFYSSESGRNVIKSSYVSSNLNGYQFVSVIITGTGVVLAIGVNKSLNTIRILRNQKSLSESDFETGWSILSDLSDMFSRIGINKVFNFTEFENKVYVSTNVGVLSGDDSGENWELIGRIGSLESVRNQHVLGQEFYIN